MKRERPNALDVVTRLNSMARKAGVVDAVMHFENIATQAQYEVPYALTQQALKPGDRVLDWGCGNGHFSFFLELLGMHVTGFSFEPPPRCMAASRDFRFVQGSEADPRALPFSDGSFDAAVSVGVLEHVWETGGDDRASLAELARVLKPGGTLLTFHLPNRTGWIERAVHGLHLKKHFHRRKYDEAQIRALWKNAGFDLLNIGVYNALPRAELRLLPGFLRHTKAFARAYGLVDELITATLPAVCTNFAIVARRP